MMMAFEDENLCHWEIVEFRNKVDKKANVIKY